MKGWKLIGIIVGAVIALLIVLKITGVIGGKQGIEVEVDKAAKRTLISKVSESGTIQADVEVPITSDVSGEVISVHVKEGEFVRKGQLMFVIRPDNFQAALEQATASLNSAKADLENQRAALRSGTANLKQDSINFQRQKSLFEQKVISVQDFETARLNYEVRKATVEQTRQSMNAAFYRVRSAEASLKQARENLLRTSVYASMDGTITRVDAEVGRRLVGTGQMAGTEAMRIADLTDMEVQIQVNENDIVNISLGDTATIEVDAFPGKLFRGRVSEIAYSPNTASGSAAAAATNSQDQITAYPVKVAIDPASYVNDPAVMAGLPKTKGPFRPGMSAMVNIFTDRVEGVVSVPIAAVTIDRSAAMGGATGSAAKPKEVVYVVDSSATAVKVKMVPVTTGISDGDFIEVKNGLKDNERLVVGPYVTITKLLNDGAMVRVKAPEQKKGPGGPGGPKGQPK